MESSDFGTPSAVEPEPPGGATDPWPPRGVACRTELDPVSFLKRTASLHPDRIAVVHGDLRRTYEELDARVNRLASALQARGLQRPRRGAGAAPDAPALL